MLSRIERQLALSVRKQEGWEVRKQIVEDSSY